MKIIKLPVVYKRLILDDEPKLTAEEENYKAVLEDLGIQDEFETDDEEDILQDVTVLTYVDADSFIYPHIKAYILKDGTLDDNKCTIEFGPFGTRMAMVIEMNVDKLAEQLYGIQIS